MEQLYTQHAPQENLFKFVNEKQEYHRENGPARILVYSTKKFSYDFIERLTQDFHGNNSEFGDIRKEMQTRKCLNCATDYIYFEWFVNGNKMNINGETVFVRMDKFGFQVQTIPKLIYVKSALKQ